MNVVVDCEKLKAATQGKRNASRSSDGRRGAGERAGGPSQPRKSRYTSFAAR
jgi:hypothetical protein